MLTQGLLGWHSLGRTATGSVGFADCLQLVVSSLLQAADLLQQRNLAIQHHAAPALQAPPLATYVQLRLQLLYLSNDATAFLPPAANLLALDRLAPGSPAVRAMERQCAQLERELFGGERPALHPEPDARMVGAVAMLAKYEIERLQAGLTRKAQQVRLHACLLSRMSCAKPS